MIRRLAVWVLGSVFWFSGTVQAEVLKLDIFHSRQPVSSEFIFPEGSPDLDGLAPEGQAEWFRKLEQAAQQTLKREDQNLIQLALGYLHILQEQYEPACRRLDDSILGNFILEDFRIVFRNRCELGLAEQDLDKGRLLEAQNRLENLIAREIELIRLYPDSPFQKDLSLRLAHWEARLGQTFLKQNHVKGAWQMFRRAMMRSGPVDPEGLIVSSLGLAETYENAENWEEVIDLLLFLLKRPPAKPVKLAIDDFLQRRQDYLKEHKIYPEGLARLLAWKEAQSALPPAKSKAVPVTEDEALQPVMAALREGKAEAVLAEVERLVGDRPGLWRAARLRERLNQFWVGYLKEHTWPEGLEALLHRYPPDDLSTLAYSLWTGSLSPQAGRVYRVLLEQHPLETDLAHKSAFFLGRIYEDLKDYEAALGFYRTLLSRYPDGRYAQAAAFKIPWIQRIQGDCESAAAGFQKMEQRLDEQGGSENGNSANSRFGDAARFWRAECESQMNRPGETGRLLRDLSDREPFSFYSILARAALGESMQGLLDRTRILDETTRPPGLDDRQRKHLARAERLAAVGMFRYARSELGQLEVDSNAPGFWLHLSRLWDRARGHQEAMGFSWRVWGHLGIPALPGFLADLLFPRAFVHRVEQASAPLGLDPLLILALMRQESAFNADIESSAAAVGLMQLLPSTARDTARREGHPEPDPEQLRDPNTNIVLGIAFFHRVLQRFGGRVDYALAAYNAGPSKVDQWVALRGDRTPLEFIESIPYNETRDYVKKVLRNYWVYQLLSGDPQRPDRNRLLSLHPPLLKFASDGQP